MNTLIRILSLTCRICLFLSLYFIAWIIELIGIGIRKLGRAMILKHPMLACEWIADKTYTAARFLKRIGDNFVIFGSARIYG